MKNFYLVMVCAWTLSAFAQQEYFSPENKQKGLSFFKEQIYLSCSDPKDKQEAVPFAAMQALSNYAFEIVSENFSQAFKENPKIKEAFQNDLKQLTLDPFCQKEGNDCRAKIMGLSIYYYQQFRADDLACKKSATECEVEEKFRRRSFEGVHSTNYGAAGVGTYKKNLIKTKNDTTSALFNKIFLKDKNNLYICNPVFGRSAFHYGLNLNEPGEFYEDLYPDYHLAKNLPKSCIEEKKVLLSVFIPTSFEKDRSNVGKDNVEPLKKLILDFMQNNPSMIISDISVVTNVSKIPFYTMIDKKKQIDPKSNEKSLSIAQQRSGFVEAMLTEIKQSNSILEKVGLSAKGQLAGPDFEPANLNERFVTKMTPGYYEMIAATFSKYKKLYETEALKKDADEFMDESKYSNLYQVKFKPFQGFNLHIQGYKKEEMKCLTKDHTLLKLPAASKQ